MTKILPGVCGGQIKLQNFARRRRQRRRRQEKILQFFLRAAVQFCLRAAGAGNFFCQLTRAAQTQSNEIAILLARRRRGA